MKTLLRLIKNEGFKDWLFVAFALTCMVLGYGFTQQADEDSAPLRFMQYEVSTAQENGK